MTTPYHARYFSHELTQQQAPVGGDRLSMALFDACVDLNPHQIDAAVFALRNPMSEGVLLADEVGLGKTIEAGLVLCQYWAKRKVRRSPNFRNATSCSRRTTRRRTSERC